MAGEFWRPAEMGAFSSLLSFAWLGYLVARHVDSGSDFLLAASLLSLSIGATTLTLQLVLLAWFSPKLLGQIRDLFGSGGAVAVSAACLATAAEALGHWQAAPLFGSAALAGATSALARSAVAAGGGRISTVLLTMFACSLGTLCWMVWPLVLTGWLGS